MSKITRPDLEPSLTCGFYNNDPNFERPRKYSSAQMSRLFDGVINDGIFKTIGTCFVVNAGSGNTVNVGAGKAWFNHTWTENDAVLPVACEDAELLLDRIDAVVLDIDESPAVADNVINVIKGTPSSSPKRPTLINENSRHQHALCYIYRKAGSTQITDSDITSMIGTDETPFITGILETTSREDWFAQWRAELDEFVAEKKDWTDNQIITFIDSSETDFNNWYAEMKRHMEDVITETDTWSENHRNTILSWFDDIKGQLSTDAATNLQIQIDSNEIENILLHGFQVGNVVKTYSDDGRTMISEHEDGRRLVKEFSADFMTITTKLYSSEGVLWGSAQKRFSSDYKTVTFESEHHLLP